MSKLSFHSICRFLVKDETFLSTVIDLTKDVKNKIKNANNFMEDIVTEYAQLIPFEKQNYSKFPSFIKPFLNPDFYRIGIKNTADRNMNIINISFLNAMNIILRPTLLNGTQDDQIKNYYPLEECITKMIERNYQIDKQKNTKKIQSVNKQHIKNVMDGKINKEIIQFVVNIFEINLVIFNLVKNEVEFYFAHGSKYPYVNILRDIHYMSYIHGNYEPILHNTDVKYSQFYQQQLYLKLLEHSDILVLNNPLIINPYHITYLNTWKISNDQFNKLTNKFFPMEYGKVLHPDKKIKNTKNIFTNV